VNLVPFSLNLRNIMVYDEQQNAGQELEFSIERIPRDGKDFQHVFPEPWVEVLLIPGYTGVGSPMSVQGGIRRSGHSFIVESQFEVTLVGECSRCLEVFDASIAGGFTHVFDPFTPKEDEIEEANHVGGISTVEDDRIRLEPIVAEEFVLLIPAYPLCSADCGGLCSDCGRNLNKGTCECEPATDPRWAKLSSLKVEEPNKDGESSEESKPFKSL
jgi:uncharacterized protein